MNQTRRPNILHIFTDQQRYDSIAANGNPVIRTPHMDRLAREGVSFRRAYSSSPECVPARACMITGHYPGRNRCYSNAEAMPPEEQLSFMERLRRQGYLTHGVGKCHFTPRSEALRGFVSRETQEELPKSRQTDDYANSVGNCGYDWILEPHGVRGEMYYIPQVSILPEQNHPTRWIGDRSVAFLEGQAKSGDPWYLYSSFIHPHPPFAPPVPWHKLYRCTDMPLPDLPADTDELLCFINRFQNRYKYRDNGLDLNLIRQMRAHYYACISFIDAQIGRLLKTLKESGQLENTLILFSSDHGEYLGDYRCFGKRGMHDASARIPMIVRWPDGFAAGTLCDTPASIVDIAPTFLESAGVEVAASELDGVSLRQLAAAGPTKRIVYSQYAQRENGLYMATDGRCKYIYSAPDQREYFFNLTEDPREHVNLASREPDHPELQRLRGLCLNWVKSTGQHEEVTPDGAWKSHPVRIMPTDPDEGLLRQDPRWWDGRLPAW